MRSGPWPWCEASNHVFALLNGYNHLVHALYLVASCQLQLWAGGSGDWHNSTLQISFFPLSAFRGLFLQTLPESSDSKRNVFSNKHRSYFREHELFLQDIQKKERENLTLLWDGNIHNFPLFVSAERRKFFCRDGKNQNCLKYALFDS